MDPAVEKALRRLKDAAHTLLAAPPTTMDQAIDRLEKQLDDYRVAKSIASKNSER